MGTVICGWSRRLCLLAAVGLLVSACAGAPAGPGTTAASPRDVLLMASTIGPIDSGIVELLENEFEKETGIRVRHVGAGTGAALDIARKGNVDLVMVHAKSLEEKFVQEGFGTERIDLMYNDFVIVGPSNDPAGIKGGAEGIVPVKFGKEPSAILLYIFIVIVSMKPFLPWIGAILLGFAKHSLKPCLCCFTVRVHGYDSAYLCNDKFNPGREFVAASSCNNIPVELFYPLFTIHDAMIRHLDRLSILGKKVYNLCPVMGIKIIAVYLL